VRGEMLPDLDSTDSTAHGQPMYHPMLVFERHTECLPVAR
jgi:hypothetical protein